MCSKGVLGPVHSCVTGEPATFTFVSRANPPLSRFRLHCQNFQYSWLHIHVRSPINSWQEVIVGYLLFCRKIYWCEPLVPRFFRLDLTNFWIFVWQFGSFDAARVKIRKYYLLVWHTKFSTCAHETTVSHMACFASWPRFQNLFWRFGGQIRSADSRVTWMDLWKPVSVQVAPALWQFHTITFLAVYMYLVHVP